MQTLQANYATRGLLWNEVRERLQSSPPTFGFSESSSLASFCTCLGVQAEMGNPKYDRLSAFLGVDLDAAAPGANVPWNAAFWNTSLVIDNGALGLRLSRNDGHVLKPRHRDLVHVFEFESRRGEDFPHSATFYPSRVAQHYRLEGFELVIVRDWLANSTFSRDKPVGYLETNRWEIESRSAVMQTHLMNHRQLALSGTHDIVDHLLGASLPGFSNSAAIFASVNTAFSLAFNESNWNRGGKPIVAYVIGVLLDDLAQPRWYASPSHALAIRMATGALVAPELEYMDTARVEIPSEFHALIDTVRRPAGDHEIIAERFAGLIASL